LLSTLFLPSDSLKGICPKESASVRLSVAVGSSVDASRTWHISRAHALKTRIGEFALNDVDQAKWGECLPVELSGRTADYALATFGDSTNTNSRKARSLVPDTDPLT
jgi:hypothetical protein